MTLTRYDVQFSESSRMWEVLNPDGKAVTWFEYASDAEEHAMDLNDIVRFEADMAALRGEEF
jgi:hypothetical protein